MLGIINILTSVSVFDSYKELSSLSNYSDLDVHFDFSLLTGSHDDEVAAATNLSTAGTPSNYNITSNVGDPKLDTSTMQLNSVAFDGSSDDILNMANAWTSSGKEFTFFTVLRKSDGSNDFFTAAASDSIASTIKITGSNNANIVIDMADIGTARTVAMNNTNPSGSTVNYNISADTDTVIVLRRTSVGKVAVYADNGLYVAFNQHSDLEAGTTFTLGAIGGYDSGSDYGGNIGEIGIYDADIGETNAIILAQELSKKWKV